MEAPTPPVTSTHSFILRHSAYSCFIASQSGCIPCSAANKVWRQYVHPAEL